MPGDDTLDRVTTERAAAVAGEQRSVLHIALFIDPGFDDLHRIAPQGCRTVLAPLAMATHMGTASEFDIPDPEADQFRHPPPGPGGRVSSVPGAGRHRRYRRCPAEDRMVIPDRRQQGSMQEDENDRIATTGSPQ